MIVDVANGIWFNKTFPTIKSWEDLNFSKKTPVADKILKDLKKINFDENQKIIQPKGY